MAILCITAALLCVAMVTLFGGYVLLDWAADQHEDDIYTTGVWVDVSEYDLGSTYYDRFLAENMRQLGFESGVVATPIYNIDDTWVETCEVLDNTVSASLEELAYQQTVLNPLSLITEGLGELISDEEIDLEIVQMPRLEEYIPDEEFFYPCNLPS